MATAAQRRAQQSFQIHEDAPTEDAEMIEDVEPRTEDLDEEEGDEDGQDDNSSVSSDDADLVDTGVQRDMDNLQNTFPGFREKYRLVRRIGEGTTHKAIRYHMRKN